MSRAALLTCLLLALPAPLLAQEAAAADQPLELLELRGVRLDDALQLLSAVGDMNVVASSAAAPTAVTLTLRGVTPREALQELCDAHGLWFQQDEQTRVFRIRTADEYRQSVQSLREAKVEVFTLLYPNPAVVAGALADLYGPRVQLGPIVDAGTDAQDISQRLRRFDLIDSRSQGLSLQNGAGTAGGGLGGGLNGSQLGSTLGGGFGANSSLNSGFGSLGTTTQGARGQPGQQQAQQQPDLSQDRVQGLSAEQIQAIVSASGTQAGREIVDRILGQATIYVSVNQRSNQLLVRTGDERALEEIRRLVASMDLPTPLVLLDVKVLSIELTDGFESVFDYQFTDTAKLAAGFSSGDVLPPPSDSSPLDGAARRSLPLSVGGTGIDPDRFLFQFVHEHFRARVQLLENQGRVTTLATPALLTANNEVSRLFAGEERPINRSFVAGATVIGDAATTVAPGNTGIEFRPVGTTLLITPNINADRTVTLRILQETSSINENGATVLVPNGTGFVRQPVDVVRSRSVSGTVVAHHGSTIAVGGLIEEEMRDFRDEVPWLGRIPFLGFFFRRQQTAKVRRELVIMIRPYVLSTPAEAEQLSRRFVAEHSIHPLAPDARGTLGTYDQSDVLVPGQPNTPGELLEMFDLQWIGKDDR